jgi:DNA-directed RNA polymerase specialized sigma24 family protein
MQAEQVAEWVRQAQRGDRAAFGCLVGEFQDLITAVCLGHLGDPEQARDAAQDTFVTALGAIKSLREPRAFVAWLLKLARTACRHERSRREGGFQAELAGPGPDGPGTADAVVLVRAGLAALRPPDRMVLALAYLGGYSQSQMAEFLGVPVSTVKKRAFDARRRLRGVLPMVEASLEAQRPSRSPKFSNVILLYAAIRRADTAAVAQLVEADPSLVEAEEAWAVDEGRSAGLVWPGRATPLIRAAEAGHLDIVEVLLGAGAAVEGQCHCETGESALWAAVANGRAGVAARLLEAGADPNCSSDSGTTALHIAVYRGRQDLVDLLQGAGADPGRRDRSGRRPADWAIASSPAQLAKEGAIVPIGLKALDLFAPLPRGGLVYWHGSYGLGQMVVLGEIAIALAPAQVSWIGFECDLLDRTEVAHLQAEIGFEDSAFSINLIPVDLAPEDEEPLLESAVRSLERRARLRPQLAVLVGHPERTAALEAYLPRLQAIPGLGATIFLSPRFDPGPPPEGVPAGYNSLIVLDPERAQRRLWPALDCRRSRATLYSSERHCWLAERARTALAAGGELPERLHAYLTQPMRVGEPFLAQPAATVPVASLLDDVEGLLDGVNDEVAVEDLMPRGSHGR